MIEQAVEYSNKGLAVIPVVGNTKKPLIPWKAYQSVRPTEAELREWWSIWPDAQIALVTGTISGLFVVDCDSVAAVEEFERLLDGLVVPTVKTPRGGRHYYFTYQEGLPTTRNIIMDHIDVRGEGGYVLAPRSQNGTGKSYEWVIGLDQTPLSPVPGIILAKITNNTNSYYKEVIKEDNAYAKDQKQEGQEFFGEGRRDENLFSVALSLANSRLHPDFIYSALSRIASTCGFPDREISIKVASAIERAGRREGKLADDVREWVLETSGDFSVTEIVKELNLVTVSDKKNLNKILSRFIKDSLIEAVGDKRGHYRRMENEMEEIDIFGVGDLPAMDIEIPFGISSRKGPLSLVDIMSRNIIIVAGSPNSGKSAFLMNVAAHNMTKHNVRYLSSEMGAKEMRIRMDKFPFPLEKWKKLKLYERDTNFHDVVDPNGINIVDYLEVTDEFWKVGEYINKIFRKLDKGIAFIAIQKNFSKKLKDGSTSGDLGLGGVRGLEKARLYITMDYVDGENRMTIKKGKNWSDERLNPNHVSCSYRLKNGCEFSHGPWIKADGELLVPPGYVRPKKKQGSFEDYVIPEIEDDDDGVAMNG